MWKICDCLRRLLGLWLLLASIAFLLYKQGHEGWEIILPGSSSFQECESDVYSMDLRPLVPFRYESYAQIIDVVLLRHALRSDSEYSLKEDELVLRSAINSDEFYLTPAASGKVLKKGRNLYLTTSDYSDPRNNGKLYILHVWIAINAYRVMLVMVIGILFCTPLYLYRAISKLLPSQLLHSAKNAVQELPWSSFLRNQYKMRMNLLCKDDGYWFGTIFLTMMVITILAALGADFLYDPFGWIDTWLYTGYGYNYPDNSHYYGYYKISRLPWILILVLLRHLARPEIATPLLAIVLTSAQCLIAYRLAYRLTMHRVASILAALFMISSTFWLNVAGWNYHAQPGGILLLLSLYLLPVNGNCLKFKQYFPAFMVISIGIHTNPLMFNMLPMIMLFCLRSHIKSMKNLTDIVHRGIIRKQIWPLILYGAITFSMTTFALSLLHRLCYGEWLFFLPNLRMMIGFYRDDSWFVPMSWGWLNYYYLLLIFAGISLIMTAIEGKREQNDENSLSCRQASILYMLALATFLLAHLKGLSVFSGDYHAYLLQCAGIIPLTTFLAWLLPEGSPFRPSLIIYPLMIGLLCVAVIVKGEQFGIFHLKSPLMFLTPVIISLIMIRRHCPGATNLKMILMAIFMACITGTGPTKVASGNASANRVTLLHYERLLRIHADDVHAGRIAGESLSDAFRITYMDDDSSHGIPMNTFVQSLTPLGFRTLSGWFGHRESGLDSFDPDKHVLPARARIVVLGSASNIGDRARKKMAEKNLNPFLVEHRQEIDSGLALHMWIYELRRN